MLDGWLRYQKAKSVISGQSFVKNVRQYSYFKSYTDVELQSHEKFPAAHWGQIITFIPLVVFGNIFPKAYNASFLFGNFLNCFFAAGLCLLFFKFLLLLGYSRKISFITTLALAFSSMMWVYSKSVFDNMQAAFFVFATFYVFYKFIHTRRHHFFYLSIVLFLCAWFTRFTVLVTSPLWVYMGYWAYQSSPTVQGKKQFLKHVYAFLCFCSTAIFIFWIYLDPFVFDAFFKTIVSAFEKNTFWKAITVFLVSPTKSIFLFNPLLLLSLFWFFFFKKVHFQISICIALISFSYLLGYAMYPAYGGDPAWGPRYVLPVIPFVFIPLASLLYRAAYLWKMAFYGFLLFGMFVQLPGVLIAYSTYTREANYERKLPRWFYDEPDTSFSYYMNPKLSAPFWLMKDLVKIYSRQKVYHLKDKKKQKEELIYQRFTPFLNKQALQEAFEKEISHNTVNLWWIRAPYKNKEQFFFQLILFSFMLIMFFITLMGLKIQWREN